MLTVDLQSSDLCACVTSESDWLVLISRAVAGWVQAESCDIVVTLIWLLWLALIQCSVSYCFSKEREGSYWYWRQSTRNITAFLWNICSFCMLQDRYLTIMQWIIIYVSYKPLLFLWISVTLLSYGAIFPKLEAHSVERVHLRHRCSDGTVNKTILKSQLALAASRQ